MDDTIPRDRRYETAIRWAEVWFQEQREADDKFPAGMRCAKCHTTQPEGSRKVWIDDQALYDGVEHLLPSEVRGSVRDGGNHYSARCVSCAATGGGTHSAAPAAGIAWQRRLRGMPWWFSAVFCAGASSGLGFFGHRPLAGLAAVALGVAFSALAIWFAGPYADARHA